MAWTKRKRYIVEAGILFSIALGLAIPLIVRVFMRRPTDLVANIYLHQEKLKSYELDSLSDEGVYYDVPVNEGSLRVHAKHGAIAVTYASCPNQSCLKQGYISVPHEMIICAHYGVYIEIEGAASNAVEIG